MCVYVFFLLLLVLLACARHITKRHFITEQMLRRKYHVRKVYFVQVGKLLMLFMRNFIWICCIKRKHSAALRIIKIDSNNQVNHNKSLYVFGYELFSLLSNLLLPFPSLTASSPSAEWILYVPKVYMRMKWTESNISSSPHTHTHTHKRHEISFPTIDNASFQQITWFVIM